MPQGSNELAPEQETADDIYLGLMQHYLDVFRVGESMSRKAFCGPLGAYDIAKFANYCGASSITDFKNSPQLKASAKHGHPPRSLKLRKGDRVLLWNGDIMEASTESYKKHLMLKSPDGSCSFVIHEKGFCHECPTAAVRMAFKSSEL